MLKVCVLLGGESSERDISVKSGNAIYSALQNKGYIVSKLDGTVENVKKIEPNMFDLIFIALHGGSGENGVIQSILEKKGIVYTGSNSFASNICLDKFFTKRMLINNLIQTPKYLFVNKDTVDFNEIEDFIPFVVKPRFEGSSLGMSIVKDKYDVESALLRAFDYGEDVLIEEYIKGRELTIGILGKTLLPIIEIIPENEFYDYDAKYIKAKNTQYKVFPENIPFDIHNKIYNAAEKSFETLMCEDYARVDIILNDDNIPYVLEVNTLPGFTETSLLPKEALAMDISFEDLCDKIVNLVLKRTKMRLSYV